MRWTEIDFEEDDEWPVGVTTVPARVLVFQALEGIDEQLKEHGLEILMLDYGSCDYTFRVVKLNDG